MPRLSEFDLIRRYFTHPARRAVLGVGDDAALLRPGPGMVLAVSTDMLVSGRHFFPDADPEQLGHKALAVNLSDMAAMGAAPRWATLSIALPNVDTRWLAAFSRGFLRLARRHAVDLVGGDTTRGPRNICVQIVGEVPARRTLRRDGARVGDDIWVSGTLGDAALALAAMQGRLKLAARERAAVARRLHAPTPRIGLGIALRGIARSAIDVSDGLVADLGHICARSRVAAAIEFARVPVSATLRRHLDRPTARAAMLGGGDDYELCFTAARSKREEVMRAGTRSGVPVARIGHIVSPPAGACAVVVMDAQGLPMRPVRAGFDHFGP